MIENQVLFKVLFGPCPEPVNNLHLAVMEAVLGVRACYRLIQVLCLLGLDSQVVEAVLHPVVPLGGPAALENGPRALVVYIRIELLHASEIGNLDPMKPDDIPDVHYMRQTACLIGKELDRDVCLRFLLRREALGLRLLHLGVENCGGLDVEGLID